MSLEILSQVLAVAGISASQEEFIFTTFKKLSVSPQPEKDLEVSLDSSCPSTKEIDESYTKSDGEHPAKLEISPCPTISFVCIQETDYPSYFSITKEDILSGPNEEMSQYLQDYIDLWF